MNKKIFSILLLFMIIISSRFTNINATFKYSNIEINEDGSWTPNDWAILLFMTLIISLISAIKFHIIATVSFILVLYMIINVASFTGMILLAIIVWLLTIMFSIIAFGEI